MNTTIKTMIILKVLIFRSILISSWVLGFLGSFTSEKCPTGGRRVFSLAFVVEFDRKGFSMLPN
jgi:hypothetical protein